MGSWRFSNIGASAKPENRRCVEKIFEYIGYAAEPAYRDEHSPQISMRKILQYMPVSIRVMSRTAVG